MARPKSSKIFIQTQEGLTEFMWANMTADGTIILGFPWEGKQLVELVMNNEEHLHPKDIVIKEVIGKPKISFHPSGQFKLTALMGKSESAIDRVTVNGPQLSDISGPERMVEILIPKQLPKTNIFPTSKDIVLDATTAPKQPFRCTIFCASAAKTEEVLKSDNAFVDTSSWEFIHALQNETHAWIWILRTSRNDNVYVNGIKIVLLGPVKWGKEIQQA